MKMGQELWEFINGKEYEQERPKISKFHESFLKRPIIAYKLKKPYKSLWEGVKISFFFLNFFYERRLFVSVKFEKIYTQKSLSGIHRKILKS